MRPCDCRDYNSASKLDEQGLRYNEESIVVRPSVVIIDSGPCTLRINQDIFKRFAEWYLEDQDE